ncbi:hypothetical protein JOD54_004683 [Actinokineospora baliensis]|uniref:hypothetical protein n=1 Tax=Actinokineospora baliensis TaxID=547056 RepID=UPI00195A14F5|nr:hypothetical protein [Actinokineospora baliensis]MBM7774479.1 hypothetical protein [Actinokineospora baliensis]
MITSVADAITAQMRALWDASAGNPGRDAKAAGEIAVSVYLGGRDHQALKRDMTTLLSRGRPTADDIVALLWPPPRRHHVTVMVSGARSLDHLDVLLPGARQLSVTVRQNPPKAAELAALVAKVGPIRARGRRVVSEALDQYVAGNRIADLTLADAWVVAGPDGRWVLGELARAGVRRAAPLSSWWSDGLRPALRVAHIARRVEAPMTSAALCWSALESIGVDEKPARLARAFALQTLRQHIVDAHAQLRLMVTDRLRRLGLRARKSQDTLRRADAVTQARQSWLDHDAAHQSALGDTTALMALVDAHVPRTTDKPLLTEPDRWLDLLLPARDTDSPALTAAHDAVTALSAFAGGLTEDTITLWRARLARPSQLAKWLQDKQDTCHALLDWLYTTRNTAFHHGRFAGPLDLATTHAAQAVVDLLLEVLGRWHTTQHTRG